MSPARDRPRLDQLFPAPRLKCHRTATPPHAPCPVFSGFFGRRQASIYPLGCSTTSNEASQQAAASLTIHDR
ncbi:hypothetical protein BHE90_013693 [Fusarium euwallaceae]|uniref:Uncharacterized protein n=1 Tax=Fusarium euwallaceae TaxID=1147111 RepID=A0A430L816_9HYPO|nr:hypothetical protein BHE90_013693 [Fusarium euwallaceae]